MSDRGTKKIVVSGVSRGLGAAMTAEFVRLGHQVFGCARSPEAIAEVRRRHREPHEFAAVDVSDDRQVAAWAEALLDRHGPPDLLVNNAGIINANAPLWAVPADEFSRLIDINVKGVFHLIRHFVPAMIERGTGVIVNFSSGWGRSTSPEVAPYCASKWAIEGLTRALADELPSGMAAVPLHPGVIHTAMLESCFGEGAAAYRRPEQWAQSTVPFLLNLGPRDNGRPLTAPAE